IVLIAFLFATTGIGCVAGAIDVWVHGIEYGTVTTWMVVGCFSYFLQVTFGLLVLSAVAPLSMAEERQRGSLDVVVATPLSTRAIVLGKWWGTFRLVPLLALGPGLMTLALATARAVGWPGRVGGLNGVTRLGCR